MNQIKPTGEIPQIELKATGEAPIIADTEQDYQAYRALLAIQEIEKKKLQRHSLTNRKQIRILQFLYAKRDVKLEKLKKQFNLPDDVSIIREINNEYLKISRKNNIKVVNITQEGKAIVQNFREEVREKKISNKYQKVNILLAIAAIIATIISIIVALNQ